MTLLAPIFTADLGITLTPGVPVTTSSLLQLIGGGKTKSGARVTEERSLGMPAVWRSVNLVAGTIAALPLGAYRENGDQREKVAGRPSDLLAKPHADMTQFEYFELLYAHQLLWGNAYNYVERDAVGRILHLWPIPPSCVQVGRVSYTGRKIYLVTYDAINAGRPVVMYDAGPLEGDMFHIPAFGYDGICGVSPIRMAREGIGLALAAEEYGARLFGSGSLATGVLQTEQRLTQAQADALHARWQEKRAGLEHAHGTIVLDKGATFHQLSIAPEDAQFIESRRFQISEIARMFGVPPHMLMDTEKSTSWGTGIEQQTIAFVVFTLRPWLTRVEQRLSRLLRPQPVYAHYNVEGLLRGDTAARAAFYKAMWELGVFSTNEIRALEERGPVEGGDVRYRPLNFGELGTTDNGQSSTTTTTTTTAPPRPTREESADA